MANGKKKDTLPPLRLGKGEIDELPKGAHAWGGGGAAAPSRRKPLSAAVKAETAAWKLWKTTPERTAAKVKSLESTISRMKKTGNKTQASWYAGHLRVAEAYAKMHAAKAP